MNLGTFVELARKSMVGIDPYSPYPVAYEFRMSNSEIGLFDKVVSKSEHYLEFGLGGSTIRALQKSRAKIETVDSSKNWIRTIKGYWYIRRKLGKRLTIHYIDIGSTREWGYPTNESYRNRFPLFSKKVFERIDFRTIDTVLVDGRFRVASALMTIIKCHSNKDLIILFHDFWNRPQYHEVLRFLDVVYSAGTLGAFKVKKGFDLQLCQDLYEKYKCNPN